MLKRLDLTNPPRPADSVWPNNTSANSQLFSGRKSLRQIVVLVDADLLTPDDRPWTGPSLNERSLLSNLLRSPLVRRFLYSDTGPPPEVTPETRAGASVYPDWVVLDPASTTNSWVAIFSNGPGSFARAGVVSNMPTIAEGDATTDAYQELPAEVAAAKRRADALAVAIAKDGIHADLFITERAFLHKRGDYATRGVTVCTPREALAIIGLYLRSQDEFCVETEFTFNRGLYYWVGTRELLPSAWRWFTACLQHSQSISDNSLTLLAGSLLQRFDRALEARDRVHVALNQKQNNDLREDALSNLDTILVSFMATFDVAARVAHRILSIRGNEHQVGWQKKCRGSWWDQVNVAEPALAAVVAAGTAGDHVLTIVRLLRNSVHGAALQGVAYVQGRARQETLVGLPPQDEAELLAAMEALGGRGSWGVGPSGPYGTLVDPGLVVERLFDLVPCILNDLMDKTPIERLPGVQLSNENLGPPTGDGSNPFETWKRQSIRFQLGL